MAHRRLSIHQICYGDTPLPDFLRRCRELGVQRVSLNGPTLLEGSGLARASAELAASQLAVESIAHVFCPGPLCADKGRWGDARDSLSRLIDSAAELGAGSIYMLTGGHGGMAWEEAADCFCNAIAPCVDRARSAGVPLAIENASALYADLHIAHSLVDSIALAEMAGIDLCIELFFCWGEANLAALFERAIPRCRLVQLSDYVCGDRSLPARAVPGDGDIPLALLVEALHGAGYRGAFELELLGPRIDAEGAQAAVARAVNYIGTLLDELAT